MRRTLLVSVIVALAIGCQSKSTSISPAREDRDTDRARAENERALELIEKCKYEQAEPVLKKAIAADVMYGPARNNLGLVYYHTNRLYLAAWEFENAIKLMPHQPAPRNNLGLVLERAGKISGAADSYAQAREIEPDNPEFIGNLARARLRHGDRDEQTRRLLEELVLKDPRPQWNDWAKFNLLRLNAVLPSTNPVDE